ncbi:MAG: hypothetical protein H0V92_04635 [Pseudonocardiales bacterium]|nr:hypothetical protein [Pseudonocardiales bacterium]
MITAVDTNVLIDIFGGDLRYGPLSRVALEDCSAEGALVVSDVVWAETAAAFPNVSDAEAAIATLGVDFHALAPDAASMAGDAWRAYRAACGPRTRVVADFLVAAHTKTQAGTSRT